MSSLRAMGLLLGMVVIVGAAQARANDPEHDYYSFGEPVTLELTHADDGSLLSDATLGNNPYSQSRVPAPSFGSIREILANMSAGKIISSVIVNLGKQAWKVVEANRPVANVSLGTATGLPQGLSDWTALEGWQKPESRVFRTVYTNLYGMEVVRFDYRVVYTYGGNAAGHGRYLAQVSVLPVDVMVAWGYTFNAEAAIPVVTNAGTRGNPVAAAQVNVSWTVDTVLKHQQQSASYYVRGDGAFSRL